MDRLSDILRNYYLRIFRDNQSDPADLELLKPGSMLSEKAIEEIETLIGFSLNEKALYEIALTHRSAIDLNIYNKKNFVSNERLEFLGDAVLDMVVAENLYHYFPDYDEGKLTKLRSQLVNARILATFARKIHLGSLLIVSDAAEAIGVRDSETTLADAFEALVGAIYLDSDYTHVKNFLEKRILGNVNFNELIKIENNYKSVLLEFAQAYHLSIPSYSVIAEEGPSHKKVFTVAVHINGQFLGEGIGRSKKAAEQLAAHQAIEKLKQMDVQETLMNQPEKNSSVGS